MQKYNVEQYAVRRENHGQAVKKHENEKSALLEPIY